MTGFLLAATALVAAILSGILGMAGGITLLGVMTAALPASQVVPLHGVVQLASNLTRTMVFLREVCWKIFAIYSLPLVVGVGGATMVWSGEKLGWFRPAIGIFVLCFLVWRRWSPKWRNPPSWIYAPLGLASGFLTLFVGATGPFIAPFFLRDDLRKEEVIATKAVCTSLGHVLKLPAFFSLGFDYLSHWRLLAAMIAAVIIGTLVGKLILEKMSQAFFVGIFEVVLAGIGIYLIVSSVV